MTRFTPFVLLASLSAAAPVAARAQVPVTNTATIDIASFFDSEIRLGLEPLVIGRMTLGLSLGLWWGDQTPTRGFRELATAEVLGLDRRPAEYQANVTARVYPGPLSVTNPKRRMSVYAGTGFGLHRRAGFPTPECPPRQFCSSGPREVAYGVEPLAEVGVRLHAFTHLFVDLGGRARLITFRDPGGRLAKGDVEPRLALAAGVSW